MPISDGSEGTGYGVSTAPKKYVPSWLKYQRSQGYGPTSEALDGPYKGYAHFNKGWDYAMDMGTPIDSIGGTIVKVVADPNDSSGWGKQVWVQDASGNIHQYGHLSKVGSFKVGDVIPDGTVIGAVGNSGKSTGPHLSYDVQNSGEYIDPGTIWGLPNVQNAEQGDANLKKKIGTLTNIAFNEYISKGKEPPASLMKEITTLGNWLSGVFAGNDMSPEDQYLNSVRAAADIMNAGVNAGQLKSSAAAARLKAYNDQFEQGLVSPNGYMYGNAGAPGGIISANFAGLPMNWKTKQEAAPESSSTEVNLDDQIAAVFGLINQTKGQLSSSGGGAEDNWQQYMDKYGEADSQTAPDRPTPIFGWVKDFMEKALADEAASAGDEAKKKRNSRQEAINNVASRIAQYATSPGGGLKTMAQGQALGAVGAPLAGAPMMAYGAGKLIDKGWDQTGLPGLGGPAEDFWNRFKKLSPW